MNVFALNKEEKNQTHTAIQNFGVSMIFKGINLNKNYILFSKVRQWQ